MAINTKLKAVAVVDPIDGKTKLLIIHDKHDNKDKWLEVDTSLLTGGGGTTPGTTMPDGVKDGDVLTWDATLKTWVVTANVDDFGQNVGFVPAGNGDVILKSGRLSTKNPLGLRQPPVDPDHVVDKKYVDDELAKFDNIKDYRAFLTQKTFVAAIEKDAISGDLLADEQVKMNVGGAEFIGKIVFVDTVNHKVRYSYEADWVNGDGVHVNELRTAEADGSSDDLLLVAARGITSALHFEAYNKAVHDRDLIRLREWKLGSPIALDNKKRIDALTGQTFTITGNSFIRATAKLAEHFNLALPAGATSWEQAITDNIGLDPIFDSTTGAWLTTPGAVWVKTNLYDAITGSPLNDPTKQPIRFNLSFRGYKVDASGDLVIPLVLSTNHDELLGFAETAQIPKNLMKEFLSLTLYKENDSIVDLQAVVDRASGAKAGEGFQVANIIKAAGIADSAKFEDKTPVNTQKSAAYSIKETDTWRTDVYTKFVTATNKDLSDQGKDIDTLKKAHHIKQVDIDATGSTAEAALLLQDANVKVDTILAISGATNTPKLSYDNTLLYISVVDTTGRKWQLMNPKHAAQGGQAFEVLSKFDGHHAKDWTEANGVIGHRGGIFSDDNIRVDGSFDHILNGDTYGFVSSYTGTVKDKVIKIWQIPAAAAKSNTMKLDLVIRGGWREKNNLPTNPEMQNEIDMLNDYINTPDATKAAALYNKGYRKQYIQSYLWESKQFNTIGWTAAGTEIVATNHPYATDPALSKIKVYGIKHADGSMEIVMQLRGARDLSGEDGYVLWVNDSVLEDVDEFHPGAVTGGIAGVQAAARTNSQAITALSTKLADSHTQNADLLAKNEPGTSNLEEAQFGNGWIGQMFVGHSANALNIGNSAKDVAIGTDSTGVLTVGLRNTHSIRIGSDTPGPSAGQYILQHGPEMATFEDLIKAVKFLKGNGSI